VWPDRPGTQRVYDLATKALLALLERLRASRVNAVVASDGTSTVDDEWQNAALNYAMQNVASVGTCSEIAAALGA